jgi:hypothetical protein
MKFSCLTAVLSLLLPLGAMAQSTTPTTPSAPAAPAPKVTVTGARVVDSLGRTATVASVDAAKREITLALDNGDSFAFIAGHDMRVFDTLKGGEKLDVDISEELSFFVTTVPGEPDRKDSVDAVRSPKGDKPGAFIERRVVASAVIEAIDYTKRTATLRGARRTVTIEVNADVKNFEQAKVGDRVVMEFIQSILVSLK